MYKKIIFTNKSNAQIKMYLHLLKATAACHTIIKKFDGKVLNARLTSAIKAENKIEDAHFSLDRCGIKIFNQSLRTYKAHPDKECWSYINASHLWFELKTVDNRINAELSIASLKKAEASIADDIASIRFDVDHYDEHKAELSTLEKQIEDYNKKWSYDLRAYITVRRPIIE